MIMITVAVILYTMLCLLIAKSIAHGTNGRQYDPPK